MFKATMAQVREDVEKALDNGRIKEALAVYNKRVSLICKFLKSPHILHLMGRSALVDTAWYLMGNKGLLFKKQKLPCYF